MVWSLKSDGDAGLGSVYSVVLYDILCFELFSLMSSKELFERFEPQGFDLFLGLDLQLHRFKLLTVRTKHNADDAV